MYPLPSTPESDEPSTPVPTFEDLGTPATVFTWVIAAGIGVWVFKKFLDGDLLQLQALHFTVKTLQSSARMVGSWALTAEQSYNERIRVLH